MKKIFLSLVAGLAATALTKSFAEERVSIDLFYDQLAPYGDWIEVSDYGYCWQPRDVGENWRPYTVGRWVYTDAGWTWDSEEPFAWAVYHYGRWAHLERAGWIWVPGTEWAPAWVSWRRGGRYVGWAPLPPEAKFSPSEGISTRVDADYDIGPSYYSFVEVRNFGAPRLRQFIVEPRENITIIQQTTNVTHITYSNNVVYNEGPRYDVITHESAEPIPRLKLERRETLGGDVRHVQADELRTRVEGDTLRVVAVPLEKRTSAPPPKVARRVQQAEVDHGWRNAGTPQEVEKVRAQIKAGTQESTTEQRTGEAGRAPGSTGATGATGASRGPGVQPESSGTSQGVGKERGTGTGNVSQKGRPAPNPNAVGEGPNAAPTPPENRAPVESSTGRRERPGEGPESRPSASPGAVNPNRRGEESSSISGTARPTPRPSATEETQRENRRGERERERPSFTPTPSAEHTPAGEMRNEPNQRHEPRSSSEIKRNPARSEEGRSERRERTPDSIPPTRSENTSPKAERGATRETETRGPKSEHVGGGAESRPQMQREESRSANRAEEGKHGEPRESARENKPKGGGPAEESYKAGAKEKGSKHGEDKEQKSERPPE